MTPRCLARTRDGIRCGLDGPHKGPCEFFGDIDHDEQADRIEAMLIEVLRRMGDQCQALCNEPDAPAGTRCVLRAGHDGLCSSRDPAQPLKPGQTCWQGSWR